MDGTIHSTTHSSLLASLSLARGERLRLGFGITHTSTQDRDRLPVLKGGCGRCLLAVLVPSFWGSGGWEPKQMDLIPCGREVLHKIHHQLICFPRTTVTQINQLLKRIRSVSFISFYLIWHFLFLAGCSTFPEKLQILIFIPSFRRGQLLQIL